MNATVKPSRQELSEKVNQEQEKFLALAQEFYDSSERNEKQALKLTEAIIAAIDNVISAEERLISTENKYVDYISRREKLYFSLLDFYGKLENHFN